MYSYCMCIVCKCAYVCVHTLCSCYLTISAVPEKVVNVTTRPDVSGLEAIIRTQWIAPHSDVTISHYIIKYTLGGVETNTTSAREAAVEAVKRGQVYVVAVAAVSVMGIGNFSEPTEVKSYNGRLTCHDHFLPI